MFNAFKAVAAIALATVGTTAAVTPAHAMPLANWYGSYVWEEPLGRIGGSDPSDSVAAFVTYRLSVGPQAGDSGCMLRAQGYQTNWAVKCTVTPEMESAVVKYYNFRSNTGGQGFVMGQKLLTLTLTESGIMTRLQGLSPASDASPRAGILFRRAG